MTVTSPDGSSVTATSNGGGTYQVPTWADSSLVHNGDGTWTFVQHRLLTSMTDPRGGVVSNVYDSQGRVTSQSDPMGRTTTFAYSGANYSASGGVTTITDPNGTVTTEDYTNGELVSKKLGSGTSSAATTSYTYDQNTLGVTGVTDPDGRS